MTAALYARLLDSPTKRGSNFFFTAVAIWSNLGDLVYPKLDSFEMTR